MAGYSEAAEAEKMTRQEVILRAMSGKINRTEAAEILRMSPRNLRRWKWRYEQQGYDGLYDRHTKRPLPRRESPRQGEVQPGFRSGNGWNGPRARSTRPEEKLSPSGLRFRGRRGRTGA